MAAAGRYLTRRHVRWLSIVHQMLAQQLQDVNPDSEQRELALLQIASLYSLEDQIANAGNEMDDHPVTTSHLDEVFIIQQNVTFPAILREWLSAFCPVIAEEIEKGTDSAEPSEDGQGLHREDTPLGRFQRLLLEAITDSRKRQTVVDYVVDHQEVIPEAQEWLALNLRRWLVKAWRNQHRKEAEHGTR